MEGLEKVIEAIAEDLSMKYEPPIKDEYWFTDEESAKNHCKNAWKKYLMKIGEKVCGK